MMAEGRRSKVIANNNSKMGCGLYLMNLMMMVMVFLAGYLFGLVWFLVVDCYLMIKSFSQPVISQSVIALLANCVVDC